MLRKLRAVLRSWLGVNDAEPAQQPVVKGLGVHPHVFAELSRVAPMMLKDPTGLVYFGNQLVVARPIDPPKLHPQVVPKDANRPVLASDADLACGPRFLALDSAEFAPTWAWLRDQNTGLGFPGYPYLAQLTQRSEYRSAAETIASEMTREWIRLSIKGKTGDETDDSDERQADDALPSALAKKPKPGEKPEPKPGDKPDDKTKRPGFGEVDEDTEQLARMDDDGGPPLSGPEDKLEDLEAALDEFGVRELFRRLIELDWFFGRSQLFIDVDPANAETEDEEDNDDPTTTPVRSPRAKIAADVLRATPLMIDPEGVPKGSLKGFKVIEPIWTTPYYYNADDPTSPDFYKPIAWFVLGRKTHASRLLTFIAREVPDILKPAYNFGGISMSQLMEPYVFQWLRTRNSVSDLIHTFSIIKLATNLGTVLQGDVAGAAGIMTRVKLFQETRDNQGVMLLDKNTEELSQEAVPLSGLGELQAQAQEHMAAPTHIPLVKLLGVTPTGLNASSEGEIKVFYDYVRSQQQIYSKHLLTVLQILQLHKFGKIDDAITFDWVPLTSPSVKELSEIRKADADSGVAYVNAGVISPDEERERLIADPNSGYVGLSGPAPEPPAMGGLGPDGEPLDDAPPGTPPGEPPGGEGKPPFGKKDTPPGDE